MNRCVPLKKRRRVVECGTLAIIGIGMDEYGALADDDGIGRSASVGDVVVAGVVEKATQQWLDVDNESTTKAVPIVAAARPKRRLRSPFGDECILV